MTKKKIKITLLVALVILFSGITVFYFYIKPYLAIRNAGPNSRTIYTGYVKIESISLPELKIKLEKQCPVTKNEPGFCQYRETTLPQYEKGVGLEIYPNGSWDFGPNSFFVVGDKLWKTDDIPGPPDPNKFKEGVRQDINKIGNILQIKEDSWKITKMEYPVDILY